MTESRRPPAHTDAKHAVPGDWRSAMLNAVRRLIHDVDPGVIEVVKWAKPSNPAGVPTWERAGILCTGETYKASVKLTFAQGATLDDPTGLFNAGFGGGTRRAIDIREGQDIDAAAFKALIKEAIARNIATQRTKKARASEG